jgi:hypothetical protein
VAASVDHRQAGDADSVAPKRISAVAALEIASVRMMENFDPQIQ